jgi:hypothetical protein
MLSYNGTFTCKIFQPTFSRSCLSHDDSAGVRLRALVRLFVGRRRRQCVSDNLALMEAFGTQFVGENECLQFSTCDQISTLLILNFFSGDLLPSLFFLLVMWASDEYDSKSQTTWSENSALLMHLENNVSGQCTYCRKCREHTYV